MTPPKVRRLWTSPTNMVRGTGFGPLPTRLAWLAYRTLMTPMKLLIADGHHRYETALDYRNENPHDPAAQFVMMTFVNMYSPGVKILATHRVLRNLESLTADKLLAKAIGAWSVKDFASLADLKRALSAEEPQAVRIGVVTAGEAYLLARPRKTGELDVPVLHEEILGGWLGIDEEAVREEKFISYVRGIDAAAAEVRERGLKWHFYLTPRPSTTWRGSLSRAASCPKNRRTSTRNH